MIEALGWETITTVTPFTEGPQEFAGVPLSALAEATGAEGTVIEAVAINDYTAQIPAAHMAEHDVFLALDLNGEPMRVRDRGPVWIIYPSDTVDAPSDRVRFAHGLAASGAQLPAMTGFRRVLRSSLVWRGAMIVALFLGVQTLLYGQREALIEKEASFGHAVLDNAWSISELMNETKNTAVRLAAYADGRVERPEVELAYDLLWSRIRALEFDGRVEFEGLAPLVKEYLVVLDRHDAAIFAAAPLEPATAVTMIGELEALSSRTRRLWSVEFNQNRTEFLGRVSGEVEGSAHEIDALMALIALGGLTYLALELFLSNMALRREQRLAAEARSASEMKTAFLANMSHEVRTPLGGVLGATELLEATALDREQRMLVQTVANSAEHLLGVVNQVLDLSKIEAGKVEIEDGIVDIRAAAQVVIGMFQKTACDKGVVLELMVGADVPPHVRGDPLRLRQVLANLVSNAVKFTETGRITVTVALASSAGSGRRIMMTVEDTGIGIAADTMARIFEAFAQSDVSDARRYGGTGLGLTISRLLARLMDGDVAVESTRGCRHPGDG